jgi:aminocarboxymuconate-semialdehyde decarboxylase
MRYIDSFNHFFPPRFFEKIGTEDMGERMRGIPERPVDCFRDFYGDTALCGSRSGIRCGIDFFGADHVLFGTDSPFDPEFGPGWIRKTIQVLETIDLPAADREKICHGNAEKLFSLDARP